MQEPETCSEEADMREYVGEKHAIFVTQAERREGGGL